MGVVHFTGFDKCIMTCIHHYRIIQLFLKGIMCILHSCDAPPAFSTIQRRSHCFWEGYRLILAVNSLSRPLHLAWQWVTAQEAGTSRCFSGSLGARILQLPWQRLKFLVLGWNAWCLYICEKSILHSQSAWGINMPGMEPSGLDFLFLILKQRGKYLQ